MLKENMPRKAARERPRVGEGVCQVAVGDAGEQRGQPWKVPRLQEKLQWAAGDDGSVPGPLTAVLSVKMPPLVGFEQEGTGSGSDVSWCWFWCFFYVIVLFPTFKNCKLKNRYRESQWTTQSQRGNQPGNCLPGLEPSQPPQDPFLLPCPQK